MTFANWITIGRLVLIPVFLVLVMAYRPEEPWLRLAALGTFVVAALSDALDGFVARAYNQKTKLGAVLDPLADKLMLNLSYVFLAVNRQFETPVPAWVPVIIISRDAIIVIGYYLLNEFHGPVHPRPRILGKLTTALRDQLEHFHALLHTEQRGLGPVDGHGDDEFVEDLRGALDEVQMAVGRRIEASGVERNTAVHRQASLCPAANAA